jgi:hypothetical protein
LSVRLFFAFVCLIFRTSFFTILLTLNIAIHDFFVLCMFLGCFTDIRHVFDNLAQGHFISSWWFDAGPAGDYTRSIVKALVKSPTHQLSISDPIVLKHRQDIFPQLLLKQSIAIHDSTQTFIFICSIADLYHSLPHAFSCALRRVVIFC